MIETTNIEGQILAFLQREVFSSQTDLTEDSDLIAGGFDSMSLMRLLLFIEKTYGFWMPVAEVTATNLKNVRSLAAVVARLIHERQAPL